jgi:hypothetical protein
MHREAAERLIRTFGYEGAKRENAKWRDKNAVGSFTYAWHVQIGKAIEELHKEQQ